MYFYGYFSLENGIKMQTFQTLILTTDIHCSIGQHLLVKLDFGQTIPIHIRGHHYRDCMVVGFTTTNAISTYMYLPWNCEFESRSWRGVLNTTLCDKVCQWLAADLWFSQSTPVSSTNQTDCHNIAEIFLKEALNTITLNPKSNPKMVMMF